MRSTMPSVCTASHVFGELSPQYAVAVQVQIVALPVSTQHPAPTHQLLMLAAAPNRPSGAIVLFSCLSALPQYQLVSVLWRHSLVTRFSLTHSAQSHSHLLINSLLTAESSFCRPAERLWSLDRSMDVSCYGNRQ